MSKDRKRKFRINAFSSKKRSYEQGPKRVYADIKKRCYNQFLEAKEQEKKFNFTTDKLAHYKKGFKKYFRNVATLTFGVPIKCKKHKLKRNNNCIERDHQYSRKLERNSRGHKDIDGISALFDLGDAYYNYIDKQKLAEEKRWRTPAERVKIKIELSERYQLLNLIKKIYAED
ncbi:MAG: DDE-type integrase/transposase/recombinase [Nanoarchaeota archaeon]|nr:DDE-type integrase/transposase/recombinase [Nanoarchaeota archaeon]MBU1855198.1 DDE-type integrase/transposase/recombinase [Nanoarchaeota archaeon]